MLRKGHGNRRRCRTRQKGRIRWLYRDQLNSERNSVMAPNFFHYATNELSQDAMICWLINWAGQDGADGDKQLRRCARRLVQALLNHKRDDRVHLRGAITTEIRQQDNRIDVLARINGQYVLLMENKTDTGRHGDQLSRGYQAVIHGETDFRAVDEEHVRPIFFRRGNQSLADDAGGAYPEWLLVHHQFR